MIGVIPAGLKGSDHPFRDSWWVEHLPAALRRVASDLTYDEVHAMELGLLGIPMTVYWLFGGAFADIVIGVGALILLAVAMFKLPRESGVFSELLSRETWYFLLVFVASSAMTFVTLLYVLPA